jgi:hypothetical protein
MRLYPIGTGRTDVFAHGPTLVLVAIGVHAVLIWVRTPRPAASVALCALALALVVVFGQRSAYRTSGDDAALIGRLHQLIAPRDGLVVYPLSTFAVGTYGQWPIRLDRWPEQGTGFEVVIERPRTLALHVHPGYTTDPGVMAADLRGFLAASYDRIVFLTATEAKRDAQVFIHAQLLAGGYRLLREAGAPPHVLIYEKTGQPATPPLIQ